MQNNNRELGRVLWAGRQWAVTDYGIETIGEPYHYFLSVQQLAELLEGRDGEVLELLIHLMEKTWLDVDDLITTFLVALTLHGVRVDPAVVRASVTAALKRREHYFGYRPDAIPRPSGGISSIEDIDKYQAEPVWHGSRVIGEELGGRADQGRLDPEPEES